MMEFLEILKYTVPSIITAFIASYFLKQHIALENSKNKFEMFSEKKKQSLPIKLQAYERMTLFLERIELENITNRISPIGFNKIEYAQLLITQINTEFEHNLVQQIYVGEDCWKLIKNAKQITLNMITAQSMKEEIKDASELKEAIQYEVQNSKGPTVIAQQIIQQEVQKLF